MVTLENRVQAIQCIEKPTSPRDIERFLGVTGYLRDKNKNYAQLAAPLQDCKMLLLKSALVKGQARKEEFCHQRSLSRN